MDKKKQNHMMTYEVYAEAHGSIRKLVLQNRTLQDVLHNLLKKCIDEDDTGIFFELENANLEILKANPKFRIVSSQKYGTFGIVLHDLKCIRSDRNELGLWLRAKRELNGYSLESLTTALNGSLNLNYDNIKSIESGHVRMKADEYLLFEKFFNNASNSCLDEFFVLKFKSCNTLDEVDKVSEEIMATLYKAKSNRLNELDKPFF